jgi:hypothetical protein
MYIVCKSSMTSCHIYAVQVGQNCSSLKMAKMYGRNKQEHSIINTSIVLLVGNEIYVYNHVL